jgi:hypothetical protein
MATRGNEIAVRSYPRSGFEVNLSTPLFDVEQGLRAALFALALRGVTVA